MCVGEGPVVHMTPSRLDWGTIPVLLDVSLCVTLSNESLIPSEFTARMVIFDGCIQFFILPSLPTQHAFFISVLVGLARIICNYSVCLSFRSYFLVLCSKFISHVFQFRFFFNTMYLFLQSSPFRSLCPTC